jgi:hypothetical protein
MSLFYPRRSIRTEHSPRIHGSKVPGRFSDSRIILPATPSRQVYNVSGDCAAFVPDHSGGPVPDLNGVPFFSSGEHLDCHQIIPDSFYCQAIL